MCGIVGFSFVDGQLAPDAADRALRDMAGTLAHRGPDAEGFLSLPDGDGRITGLGHRRLSILELSAAGAQPMSSRCGRYAIAFNGEIYNHGELRAQVEARRGRQPWRGRSDTEVLVELIAEVGLDEALRRLDGQFALALHDRLRRTVSLARDPFGEKPLYYASWGGALLFASELRALGAWPGFAPRQDATSVADYFRFGYVPSPATILEGVSKLPPASVLVVTQADLSQRRLPGPVAYWDPVAAARSARDRGFRGSPVDAAAEVEQALRHSVAARIVADVPVGAFLSGGIDSALTTALMQEVAQRRVRTFSLGIDMPGYDESGAAAAVARTLGTEHREVRIGPADVLDALPRLLAVHDEPFADSSMIPTFLLSRAAREDVKVVLSGDGGDELFGGYNRHFHGPRLWSAATRLPRWTRRAFGGLLRTVPEGWIDGAVRACPALAPRELVAGRAGAKVHKLGRLLGSDDSADFQEALLAIGEPSRLLAQPVPHTRLAHRLDGRVSGFGMAELAMLIDTTNYLPDDVLTKVDRASMAVGLEARTPFLDRAVFDLAWRLPAAARIGAGQGKQVLRDALARRLPPAHLARPKSGFGVPIGAWLRGPLRGWAHEMLCGPALGRAEALDGAAVRALWTAHGRGRTDHGPGIWSVLMYIGWLEQARCKAARA